MAISDNDNNKDNDEDCSCFMYDLSPSWTRETIAVLLNKQLLTDDDHKNENTCTVHHSDDRFLRVQLLVALPLFDNAACESNIGKAVDKSQSRTARLTFGTAKACRATIQAYQGLAIPMTHGYHYYAFGTTKKAPTLPPSCTATGTTIMQTESPPVHLQLLALPTATLQRRLARLLQHSSSLPPQSSKQLARHSKKNRVLNHARLAHALTAALPQRVHDCRDGVPLDPTVTQPLLDYLRRVANCDALWPPPIQQRKGVQAGRYLTLRQNNNALYKGNAAAAKLWHLCRTLLHSVVVVTKTDDAPYTALAITANFQGSPHVDAHDTTVQYVVALGDFQGGQLCVDDDHDNDDNSSTTVTQINVHNRLGRLEGRQVHWVQGWTGRDRYSVVYYSTSAVHATPIQPQSLHNAWMRQTTEATITKSKQGHTQPSDT